MDDPGSDGSQVRWTSSPGAAGKDYTKAKEKLLQRTDIPEAPWWVVQAVDNKRGATKLHHHLLTQIPYDDVPREAVVLPERMRKAEYARQPVPKKCSSRRSSDEGNAWTAGCMNETIGRQAVHEAKEILHG